jgi:hypothetical protein
MTTLTAPRQNSEVPAIRKVMGLLRISHFHGLHLNVSLTLAKFESAMCACLISRQTFYVCRLLDRRDRPEHLRSTMRLSSVGFSPHDLPIVPIGGILITLSGGGGSGSHWPSSTGPSRSNPGRPPFLLKRARAGSLVGSNRLFGPSVAVRSDLAFMLHHGGLGTRPTIWRAATPSPLSRRRQRPG